MSGPSIPKDKPIRSAKLREAAKDAPECFSCHRPNDGTVVGCHPNGLKYGKGMSQKANDLVSYLCARCHTQLDQREGSYPMSRLELETLFLDSFYWSTVWLIRSGRLG